MPKQPTPELEDDALPTPPTPNQGVNWEEQYTKLLESYNGLQGNAKQTRDKNAKLVQEREAYLAEIEGLKLDLQGSQAKYTTELQQAQQRAAELEKTAKSLQKQRDLSALIRKDYPALNDLEDVLRIDDLEGDALKTYLDNLSSRVAGVVEKKTDTKLSGSLPPPPKPADNKKAGSLKEIGDRLQDATKAYGFNSSQYKQVYAEYESALEQGISE